jgi:Arc/MetJ-type ribon-helix-helix transcriptional regulator
MRLVTVKMPEMYVRGIDELVKAGRYSSRSEVIRIAVRELLKRELWGTAVPAPLHEIPLTRVRFEVDEAEA